MVQQVEYPAGPGGVRLPSGYQLQIGSLRPSWLTTVEMEDVRLSKSSAHPDVPSGHIAIDELHASVSLFPLLVGEIDASFDIELREGGRIGGSLGFTGSSITSGDLNLSNVELSVLLARVPENAIIFRLSHYGGVGQVETRVCLNACR